MSVDMDDRAHIDGLLARWEDARERGQSQSAEDLCADRPELVRELARRIQGLLDWDKLAADGPRSHDASCDIDGTRASRSATPPACSVDISMVLGDLSFHERGGLGEIFRAQDRGLPRTVALKFVSEGAEHDPMNVRRFLREAQVTARLENPGIVPIHGMGRDASGRLCYATRFIDGTTLKKASADYHRARKARRKRVPLRQDSVFRALLQRFRSACSTVAYAHHVGFLHRDLKPEHIMLGPFEETLVVDWGLARLMGRDEMSCAAELPGGGEREAGIAANSVDSETRGGIGTPGFASPEQQVGDWQRVGPASDIFSMGATLYVLLAGVAPFAEASVAAVLARVENHQVSSPVVFNSDVPRDLAAICMKALSHRPEDRYQTATELARDLEAWLSGDPISALSDSWRARLRRWTVRHPKAFAGTLATLLAGLVGLAGIGWLGHRASLRDLQRREESLRHTEQLREARYANAEKTAREIILERRPGWVGQAINKITEAARIDSPLRSRESLRSIAAECLGGIDVRERAKLTSINSACQAFGLDGRLLAIGEHHGMPDFHVEVYEVQSRALITRLTIRADSPEMKRTGVSALAFSPDGKWLAGGFRNGEIVAWSTEVWSQAPMVLGRHKTACRGLAFMPDGAHLISGSADGTVKLWTWDLVWKLVRGFEVHDVLSSLTTSPDGRLLAIGCDGSGQIVDFGSLNDGNAKMIYRFGDCAHQFRFHPDGRTTAGIAGDGVYCMSGWPETPTRTNLLDPGLNKSHSDEINSLAFHPSGSFLVSSSNDNTIKVWDLAANQLALTIPVFTQSLINVVFDPAGSILAVATSEGTTLHDFIGVETVTASRQPEVARAFSFVPVPDDPRGELVTTTLEIRHASTAEHYGNITCRKLDAKVPGQIIRFKSPSRNLSPALALDSHPVRRLIAHNGDYSVAVYDVDRGDRIGHVAEPRSTALAFSREGERLWGVIDESRIVSWSVPELIPATSWALAPLPDDHGRVGISSLAAGRKWVVAGSRAGRVHVFRATDGTLSRTVKVGQPIRCIEISPDDDWVACGLVSGKIARVGIDTDPEVVEIVAHQDMVNSLAFSTDGRLLATGGRDKSVMIWGTVKQTPTRLLSLRSTSGRPVIAVKFSNDAHLLGVLAQNERAVRLWHLDKLHARLGELGVDWEDDPDEPGEGQ